MVYKSLVPNTLRITADLMGKAIAEMAQILESTCISVLSVNVSLMCLVYTAHVSLMCLVYTAHVSLMCLVYKAHVSLVCLVNKASEMAQILESTCFSEGISKCLKRTTLCAQSNSRDVTHSQIKLKIPTS